MKRLTVTALALLALLAGCAPTTELLRDVASQPAAGAGTSLLVVGMSNDDAVRLRYETVFVQELERAGVRGIASSTLVPSLKDLDMAQLRVHMHTFSGLADLVLHSQLAGLVATRGYAPDAYPLPDGPAATTIGGVNVTFNAPANADSRAPDATLVDIEASLYSGIDRKLLWTAFTRTDESTALEQVARSHARFMIGELRKRGYLAGPAR